MCKNDLYLEFIQDNPDFAPKAKRTISRTEFYRWLNSFGIKLMGNQSLFEVFHDLVSDSCYNYLVIDMNQSLKRPQVYTHVLFEDSRPFIKYHIDSDSE